MLDVVASLRSAIKRDPTDHGVFQLHYLTTSTLLLLFSFLVTSRQYFGNPINCFCYSLKDFQDVLDSFCWIHPTFTVRGGGGGKIPHQGIRQTGTGREDVYHKYYQWVGFVLFFQAFLFYAPRYLWKMWEAGRMEKYIARLNDEDFIYERLSTNTSYALMYAACELLCAVNLAAQIYGLDVFLGGEFITYGLRASTEEAMAQVFPRVTKCTYQNFGTSGDVQNHDAMCVLPLNALNEKIFLVLWLWFAALIPLTLFVLVYRASVVCSSRLRCAVFGWRCGRVYDPRLFDSFGGWFVLFTIGINTDAVTFRKFINNLSRKLDGDEDQVP